MSPSLRYSVLILDLGDVLFSWSSKTDTSVSSRTLNAILNSKTWFEYERGRISQAECYERTAAEFSLDASEIANAFLQARNSLESNNEMITLVRELKAQSNGRLLVFALSNISIPDYEFLLTKPADWSIFDKAFPSGLVGERKPHLGIYKHVLADTGIDPHTAVFVDDKADNVLSARSLGMHGIVFEKQEDVLRQLRNLFGDPVGRGHDFLRRNAGTLESVTSEGVAFEENFTQLLIQELTEDESLVKTSNSPRTWNFFRGKPLLSDTFPNDMDTTSLALTILKRDSDVISSVMDEMLQWRDEDGIMQTYFDETRPWIDPYVNVNVLTLFYTHGRGHELDSALNWVREVLLYRAYLGGSRYYPSPESFLFFMSRLIPCTGDTVLHQLRPLFIERVRERIGTDGDAMELAMRLISCDSVGLPNDVDMQKLLSLQCEDGGWKDGWLYRFGTTGLKVGNRGLTTALAVKAIENAQKQCPLPLCPLVESVHVLDVPKVAPTDSRPSSPFKPHFLRQIFNNLRLLWRKIETARSERREAC